MNGQTTIVTGMVLMAFGVAMGAFGAHALKTTLLASGRTDTYELAIRYLMIHAIALLIFGTQMDKWPGLKIASILLLVGILFFSGSLLILSLANQPRWGAVAPIGGTALIAGWLAAAWAVIRSVA